MAKMGRPKIELSDKDWDQLEKLCAIHCTGEESAAILGIEYDTLCRRIRERYDLTFAEYFKEKSAVGKMSLRRRQYELAQKNVVMSIWLGKQWLGQRDKQDVTAEVSSSRLVIDLSGVDVKKDSNE